MSSFCKKILYVIGYALALSPLLVWSAWNNGVGGENGFFVPNGSTLEIRQWSTCRRVQPVGCPASGIFVPTKTQLEWRQFTSFTSNLPSCVTAPQINCY